MVATESSPKAVPRNDCVSCGGRDVPVRFVDSRSVLYSPKVLSHLTVKPSCPGFTVMS